MLETPLGNEYLNATLFPTLPVAAEMPFALESSSHPFHATFPTHSSQPDLNSSHLSTSTNNGVTRYSPGASVSAVGLQRHSTLGPPPVKKRVSAVGTTSSHARLFKVYGDFFLLAGRTQDSRIWSVVLIYPRVSCMTTLKVPGSTELVQGRDGLRLASVSHGGLGCHFRSRLVGRCSRTGKSLLQSVILYITRLHSRRPSATQRTLGWRSTNSSHKQLPYISRPVFRQITFKITPCYHSSTHRLFCGRPHCYSAFGHRKAGEHWPSHRCCSRVLRLTGIKLSLITLGLILSASVL